MRNAVASKGKKENQKVEITTFIGKYKNEHFSDSIHDGVTL
jgi:hypothetical protein